MATKANGIKLNLKELAVLNKTMTTAQIAEKYGVTKNVIAGRLYRAGLGKGDQKLPEKPVFAFNPSGCQWPIGDPREPKFHYCGKPITRYTTIGHRVIDWCCKEHLRIAYLELK